jgi:hypothetical protein
VNANGVQVISAQGFLPWGSKTGTRSSTLEELANSFGVADKEYARSQGINPGLKLVNSFGVLKQHF